MDQFSTDANHNPLLSTVQTESEHKDECNNNEALPQPSSKEVTESCSQSSIGSSVLQVIDQGFADYISSNKSLQRVDFTPDPIPRFFVTGMNSPSYTKNATSASIPEPPVNQSPNVKDMHENSQSSTLVLEKSSKSISAKDLASDDDGNHPDDKKIKKSVKQRRKSSSSLPKWSVSRDKHQPDKSQGNDINSRNISSKTVNNNKEIPALSTFLTSTNDDRIVELKQPAKSPSITSSVRSATSNGSNLDSDMQETVKKGRNQAGIIPRKTKQDHSQSSLSEIESFHREFVGNISMLARPPSKTDNAKEKKVLADPVVGSERGSARNGNDECVGEKIKNGGQSQQGKDVGIPSHRKKPQSSKKVTGFSAQQNVLLPSSEVALDSDNEDKNNDNLVESPSSGKREDQPSFQWEEDDSTCPKERLSNFVNKYIDSVEGEWQVRRSCWLENNKHNPNSKRKKNSVYAYETFKEYMQKTNNVKRIDLQFPYNLPGAGNNNRNPTLKDEKLLAENDSSTKHLSSQKTQGKASQIPKLNVAGGGGRAEGSGRKTNRKVNNIGNDDEQLPRTSEGNNSTDAEANNNNNNPQVTPENVELVAQTTAVVATAVLDTVNEEEEPTVPEPMDLTPFMNQCGDIFDELKNIIKNKEAGTAGDKEERENEDEKVDKIVGTLVKKYIDFLEDEWKSRRDAWMKKNKVDDNSLYQSFETFEEGLRNRQVEAQVPFTLPDVDATKKIVPDSLNDEIPSIGNNLVEDGKSNWWDSLLGFGAYDSSGVEATILGTIAKLPTSNDNGMKTTGDQTGDKNGSSENIDGTPISVTKSRAGLQESNSSSTKVNSTADNSTKKNVAGSDDISLEPLVEIYKGLSREDTSSNLKGTSDKPLGEYQAFVNGRTVICKSLEQKTRLDICCLKLNTVQTYAANLKDMTTLPGAKVLCYLSLSDWKNCRLVSKSWNTGVITLKHFLSRTTFVVEKKPLGALATLESSRVRWQHLRCAILPSMNFSSASYNGRFLSSNLRVTPMSSRNEPVTSTVTTVIFQNIDIHKQQLVQWIQNCKRLNSIEVQHCNFLKSTISMNMDRTNRVMERVQVMKFIDMEIVKLAEALRFFLPATQRLHTLEIVQRREPKGIPKSATFTTRKGAEDDILSILNPVFKKNAVTLKVIRIEMSSAKNHLLQSKVLELFQNAVFRLNSLVIRSYTPQSIHPSFNHDSYSPASRNLIALLKNTLRSSREMTLLDFPMLSIDFADKEGGSQMMSSKLERLSVQLEMPQQETKSSLDRVFPNLTQLELYNSPQENARWLHLRETMPALTELVVFSGGIRDMQLQCIIRNLKLLQVLRLESVQDITDYGITGMEQGWIDRLKLYWPEKMVSSSSAHDQFPRDKIRFCGKSLSSLADLRTFIMKGEFSISNVGILYGFHSRELTTLELHGGPVNASNSGLFILGFQCPRLRRAKLTVMHSKVNELGVRDFMEGLQDSVNGLYEIEVFQTVELEPELGMKTI